MKIQELLRQNKVPFEVATRPADASLATLADEGKIPRSELASVTLLRADHGYRYLLAVSPLDHPLDLRFATRALEGCALEPASAKEQIDFCPDCEKGTLMPFGSHYNVRTLLDQTLAELVWLTFEEIGGEETIRMKAADFCALENPFVVPLTHASCETVG